MTQDEPTKPALERPGALARMALRTAALGALDGAIATLPMTVVMAVGNQITSPGLRLRALPPTRVGKKISALLGLPRHMSDASRAALGMLAHLGVGAVSGVLYRSTRAVALPGVIPAPVDYAGGTAFGTAVWAAGYLGVLPAMGLVERPARAPRGQTLTMVVAHWVYGAALTALARRRRSATT